MVTGQFPAPVPGTWLTEDRDYIIARTACGDEGLAKRIVPTFRVVAQLLRLYLVQQVIELHDASEFGVTLAR